MNVEQLEKIAPIDLYDAADRLGLDTRNAYLSLTEAGWVFVDYDPTYGTELYAPPKKEKKNER